MSFIRKPSVNHSQAPTNRVGLRRRDYEGGMSTLCAGCGHDSITAAFVQAFWELNVEPHRVAKMSGIGCSSKTPAYFLSQAHGINTVHGRMPSIATGAGAANRDMYFVGVSGDGDSLSIGLGQFAHAIRRNLDMLYVIENNGVYGLTKGQFSASADIGSKSKRGEANQQRPIDPVALGINLGATFVARSFSGDKAQLVPLIKAGLSHRGFSLIDVMSPCVTFNDHEDSTKSYAYTRQFYHPAIHTDFIPAYDPIEADGGGGEAIRVDLHDGTHLMLKAVSDDYDPTDRGGAFRYVTEHRSRGQVVTGLLYLNEEKEDMHAQNRTSQRPLRDLGYDKLNPGSEALGKILSRYR
ncbi:MAG: 2-oxoacid:ferredoxin oxidoreductase subunit beta [Pseudomonadota bacterium]